MRPPKVSVVQPRFPAACRPGVARPGTEGTEKGGSPDHAEKRCEALNPNRRRENVARYAAQTILRFAAENTWSVFFPVQNSFCRIAPPTKRDVRKTWCAFNSHTVNMSPRGPVEFGLRCKEVRAEALCSVIPLPAAPAGSPRRSRTFRGETSTCW